MPLSLIFAIVVLGFGIALALFLAPLLVAPAERPDRMGRRIEPTDEDVAQSRRATRVLRLQIGAATLVAVGLLIFSASFTVIGARTVGVETSFGQTAGTRNSTGFVNPLHKVEKFDASSQTLVMKGDEKKDDVDAPGITVRLGNQTTARVDVERQSWNLNQNGDIQELYRRYKNFGNIEKNLIIPQASNAMQKVLAGFDPLAGVNGDGKIELKTTDQLASDVQTEMQSTIDGLVGAGAIKVEKPQMFVNYDQTTQDKLNTYAQALADTRIATQGRLTAEQRALANKALAAQTSVTNSGVQYQNCLDLLAKLATDGKLQDLPPTFNCGDPRSNVIVNSGK